MVLFLFVIMLLDLREEEQRRIKTAGAVLGLVTAGALYLLLLHGIGTLPTQTGATLQPEGSTAALGRILFTDFLLPFEIVSLLLLVAMVGVVLLSKRDLK